MSSKPVILLVCLLLVGTCAGCSNVQVLRLTSETFPAHPVNDVAILSHEPSSPHVRIAELSETSSPDELEKLQQHLLKKAADLGADAVVFSTPVTHTEQRIDYQPAYNPWGYYAPYYYGPGPYGYWRPWGYRYGAWGAGPYMPVPYSVRRTTLKGVAIKYS